MPRLPADDELLRPTLAAEDDPVHMRQAWNPWTLAVLAVLGGPLAGGVLFGENSRRLGRKQLGLGILAGSALLLFVSGLVAARLRRLDGLAGWDEESVLSLPVRGAAVLLAAPLATFQNRRFQVFTRNGGEPGNLWLFGFAALAVGVLAHPVALWVMRWTS